jgi:hypothetical protein
MAVLSPLKVKNSGYVELKKIIDARDGVLCIMEGGRDIPFEIKRVYYITHIENDVSIRGKHAHRTLNQVIFCISGSFVLSLDDGHSKQDILMRNSDTGVILGPRLWHTMHNFSSGCVLLIVASDYYDEEDYIRNYHEFIQYIQEPK